MTVCTSRPSRGPAARALTVSRCSTAYAAAASEPASHQAYLLDVELVGEDRLEAAQRGDVVDDHGERRERQPGAQRVGLAQRQPGRGHVAHLVHRGDERVVGRQRVGLRPVGEVHRPLAGQPAPDLLGHQRHQRGGHPADRLQDRPEGVERLDAALARRSPRTGRASGGCTSWSARRGRSGSRRTPPATS